MIKTVIFDIDDTMYDYTGGNRLGIEAVNKYCAQNLGITEEIFRQALVQSKVRREEVLGVDNAAVHSRLLRYQCMLEILDMPVFPHAAAMSRIYWETLLDSIRPQPGLKE